MDFRFTPEEEAFRQEVHDFIENECPKELRGGDVSFFEQAGSLFAWRRKVAEKGWVAPAWPKEYGGAGMSIMEQFVYSMETARMRAPAPIFIGALAVAVIGPTIIIYGTEEQKQKHIPKILAGEEMWCQGFSEPGSGSDLASLQTRAVKDGDDYVINGQKIWTTLAHMSQYMLLLARTDPDVPKHKGLSYFIVPMNAPGVTVRPLMNMAGTHEFNEVFFDNVRIPAKNLVGEQDRGWYQAVTTLDIERSNIGSAVGQQQTVEDLVRFAKENKSNGVVRIKSDPMLRTELAERYPGDRGGDEPFLAGRIDAVQGNDPELRGGSGKAVFDGAEPAHREYRGQADGDVRAARAREQTLSDERADVLQLHSQRREHDRGRHQRGAAQHRGATGAGATAGIGVHYKLSAPIRGISAPSALEEPPCPSVLFCDLFRDSWSRVQRPGFRTDRIPRTRLRAGSACRASVWR